MKEKTNKKKPDAKNKEERVCGIRACRASFKNRPNSLIRFYLVRELLSDFKDIMKFCADKKLAYHIVSDEDLRKIAHTKHHEGVCMIMRQQQIAPSRLPVEDSLKSSASEELLSEPILILEGVENPHNLGAIVRTASHFGLTKIFYFSTNEFKPSTAALRTAQGGFEDVKLVHIKNISDFITALKKSGYTIFGTSDHKSRKSLYKTTFPKKLALFFGSETKGMSDLSIGICDEMLIIPHAGIVKSLNVSSAFAIFLSEIKRQLKFT